MSRADEPRGWTSAAGWTSLQVRTSDQFYLLAAQSFQDMNDWVNCLRLVAFGQSSSGHSSGAQTGGQVLTPIKRQTTANRPVDVLLENRGQQVATSIERTADYVRSLEQQSGATKPLASAIGVLAGQRKQAPEKSSTQLSHPAQTQKATASQAAAAAASALAKTRQRQPSLLGSCKPQPPTDSPFIQPVGNGGSSVSAVLSAVGQMDTLTPTVRGQLISTAHSGKASAVTGAGQSARAASKQLMIQSTLDEEEENMLYCSIEDNPSEHNYRVKVIETELSLRCQLKCYQLTAPTTISQQYEELGNFSAKTGAYLSEQQVAQAPPPVTFYQLIIGPQELTLLNDYAAAATLKRQAQQQGLWSWPYQCIRRYGFDKDNCFMFEAGRKCSSGPGQFIVQTPKAYQIYQDVVKFVNELRSLNSSALTSPESNGLASTVERLTESRANSQSQPKTVTQIPVTWAPASAGSESSGASAHNGAVSTPTNSTATTDSRQQFFNTLRQLDSSSVLQTAQRPPSQSLPPRESAAASKTSAEQVAAALETSKTTTATTTTTTTSSSNNSTLSSTKSTSHDTSPSACSQTSDNRNGSATGKLPATSANPLATVKRADPSATSDETDESGYEQGDESVDGSASRLSKLSAGAVARKRQANDSMSSSSSTSSGGGSPGHSVSRRAGNGVFGELAVSKRPPLSAAGKLADGQKAAPEGGDVNSRLRSLIGSVEQAEDFEASLIRDVYSEITKLHAKFAVTSGSAEDLMSSNSSNEGSASSDRSMNAMNEEDYESMSAPISEPMYSNLKSASKNTDHLFSGELANRRQEHQLDSLSPTAKQTRLMNSIKFNQPRPQLSHSYNSPYQQHDLNGQRPGANPYPQNQFVDHYLSSSPRTGPLIPTLLNPIPECGELAPAHPKTAAKRQQQPGANPTRDSHAGHDERFDSRKNAAQRPQVPGAALKSRLPTNHYVINDVQYAKISRNIRSNLESCL